MGKIQQKQAVYEASMYVLKENNINFKEGVDTLVDILNKEMRAKIVYILMESFKMGKIVLNKPKSTDTELKKYTNSIISNWAKKDIRLNGGIKYERNNDISIRSDNVLSELNKFLKQIKLAGDPYTEERIKIEINNRKEALRMEQLSNMKVDENFVPDNIKHLI